VVKGEADGCVRVGFTVNLYIHVVGSICVASIIRHNEISHVRDRRPVVFLHASNFVRTYAVLR
jgi:hypothetical protein